MLLLLQIMQYWSYKYHYYNPPLPQLDLSIPRLNNFLLYPGSAQNLSWVCRGLSGARASISQKVDFETARRSEDLSGYSFSGL